MEQKETVQAPAEENEDIEELLQNPIVSKILNSRITTYFKKNTGAKIAVITAILTAGSFVVQLFSYVYTKGLLSVYDVSIDTVLNDGLFKFLMYAVSFIGIMISIAFLYLILRYIFKVKKNKKPEQAAEEQRKKQHGKIKCFFQGLIKPLEGLSSIIVGLFIVGFVNYWILVCVLPPKLVFSNSIVSWVISIAFLMFIEIVGILFVTLIKHFKNSKKEKLEKNYDKSEHQRETKKSSSEGLFRKTNPIFALLTNLIVFTTLFVIFSFSALAYYMGVYQATKITSYRFVNENYAIIYEDNQHYWLVRAEDEAGKLKVYTPTQKIISVEGVETTRKNFQEVEFIYTDTADDKDNPAG